MFTVYSMNYMHYCMSFCILWVMSTLPRHYSDVIMSVMGSQITSLTIIFSTVESGTGQRNYQSPMSLAFVCGNSPVTGEFHAQRASNAENVSSLFATPTLACEVILQDMDKTHQCPLLLTWINFNPRMDM